MVRMRLPIAFHFNPLDFQSFSKFSVHVDYLGILLHYSDSVGLG